MFMCMGFKEFQKNVGVSTDIKRTERKTHKTARIERRRDKDMTRSGNKTKEEKKVL